MKLKANIEFSVFDLFLRKKDSPIWMVSQSYIQTKLLEFLNDYDIEIVDSDSLYFKIDGDGIKKDEVFYADCFTKEELKKKLPERLWDILEEFDKKTINMENQ